MGLLGFRKWLEARCRHVAHSVDGEGCFDHVLLDLNSVIHEHARGAATEAIAVQNVVNEDGNNMVVVLVEVLRGELAHTNIATEHLTSPTLSSQRVWDTKLYFNPK
eukprot:gene3600-2200_t